jgi:hypothetical protein
VTQRRQRRIDLDEVASELAGRNYARSDQGINTGPLTWRDAQATWPQPIHTDRSLVAKPESLGITLTTANGNQALIIIWRGGWADVDVLVGTELTSRAPDLHDVADCITLAESIANRLSTRPASEESETRVRRTSSGAHLSRIK